MMKAVSGTRLMAMDDQMSTPKAMVNDPTSIRNMEPT